MKNRNLVIASVLLTGFLAAKSGFTQEVRREDRNLNTSKSPGEIHNDGVKYVLEHIKEVPSRENLGPLVARLTNEFCVESRTDCGTLNPDWRPSSTEQILSTLRGSKAFKENIRSLFSVTQSIKTTVTKRALQRYQLSLDQLEKTAARKLKGEERTRFLGAISIARSSAVFWAPRKVGGLDGKHFLDVANPHNGNPAMDIDWGHVFRADVGGWVDTGSVGGAIDASVEDFFNQLMG